MGVWGFSAWDVLVFSGAAPVRREGSGARGGGEGAGAGGRSASSGAGRRVGTLSAPAPRFM